MKLEASLEFEAEVVEQQRLLNGAEYLTLEGEGIRRSPATRDDRFSSPADVAQNGSEPWSLTLSFERRKEPGAELTDGDLSLIAPDGALFGELQTGRAAVVVDELAGDERTLVELAFQVRDGEGRYDGAAGAMRVEGEIAGTAASLRLALALDA